MLKTNSPLLTHWCITAITALIPITIIYFCNYYAESWRQILPEEQRLLIRTIFYIVAILDFPLTNLLRHILLRLNQTMPGSKPAAARYLTTIIVAMTQAATLAILGLVMYLLGDDTNTLTIFLLLSGLAIFLYRPKQQEYERIVESLRQQREDHE